MNRRRVLLALLGTPAWAQLQPLPDPALAAWATRFSNEVDHRLEVPAAEQAYYTDMLTHALGELQPTQTEPQAFVLVDRSPNIQAAMVLVHTAAGWYWLGATAVSTGKPGSYEHFVTPLGVFAHTLDNPDFRAEGTFNKNHIRGYGLQGLRVFDFGWQDAVRGWGDGGMSSMRLQMHATDPAILEGRLGSIQSEGCVRIPTRLNRFLDRHGVLDRDYQAAIAAGAKLWLVQPGQTLLPWPGQYLVVVDSGAPERPAWSPLPQSQRPAVKTGKTILVHAAQR